MCDITAICEIFAEKNERLIYSDSFFLICVNELKEKYNIYINKNSLKKIVLLLKWITTIKKKRKKN